MSKAGNDIMDLISERGSKLMQVDYESIRMKMVDIPLEDSDEIGSIMSAIHLVVSDPLYDGDIELSDLED